MEPHHQGEPRPCLDTALAGASQHGSPVTASANPRAVTGRGKGNRAQDITPEVRDGLDRGVLEAATLTEALSVDFPTLLRNTVPAAGVAADTIDPQAGITRRMSHAARIILDHVGVPAFNQLATHSSDTVRGWAAYLLAITPDVDLPTRLSTVRPLADDSHFAVREWAWLALRPEVADDIRVAIDLLTAWTSEPSANLRRFAVEITRPRGVWARHIRELAQQPDLGLPLLEPLHADPSRYVQDSVANWINDAAKTSPDWAVATCDRWLNSNPSTATQRICNRALRSLPPKKPKA